MKTVLAWIVVLGLLGVGGGSGRPGPWIGWTAAQDQPEPAVADGKEPGVALASPLLEHRGGQAFFHEVRRGYLPAGFGDVAVGGDCAGNRQADDVVELLDVVGHVRRRGIRVQRDRPAGRLGGK